MPARGKGIVYTPKGTTVSGPKGAKTFVGKGPASSGTKKLPEKSYSEAPTITTSPTGVVSTSGFSSPTKAQRAARRTRRTQARVLRMVSKKPKATPVKTLPRYEPPKVAPPRPSNKLPITSQRPVSAPAIAHAEMAMAKLPAKKVKTAYGKPTLGTPTLKEVAAAKRQGRLSGIRKGKVVATPKARKAAKRLKRAQRAYSKKATPEIHGLLNEEQQRFAQALSKYTKIPPKLAGEWVLQESGASSAGAGGEAGEQNQLGVGYPAHPTSFSQSPYFNNTTPEKAAKATADWMEGKIGSEYDYSVADSIKGIPALAKSGASEDEIRSYIEGASGWGTGQIAQSGVTASGGKAPPKVTRQLKKAQKKATRLGIKSNKSEPVSYGAKPAKRIKGQWAGTEEILLKAAQGIEISSEKRTPEHNAAIGGSPTSDHLTTNTNAFATDLPTTDGVPIADKVTKRLGISGWSPGNYDWYTTPKYPGYRFQVLWEVEGHYDHVHVGAEWTGENLPAGTISGGSITSSGSGGTATFTPSGGGESVAVPAPPKEVQPGKSVTPLERYNQTKKQLRNLGVSEKPQESKPSATLKELESKYIGAA